MKAFWYNDDRKNVCGIKIRELRKEKHLSTKKLEIIFMCYPTTFLCNNYKYH